MKYLAKSAEVLNEADRFQQMLDWELFTSNQDIQLNHSYVDGVMWRPGDFLYDFPGLDVCDHLDCESCAERRAAGSGALPNPDYEGNCVRPMIQDLDIVYGMIEGVRGIWDGEDYVGVAANALMRPICCDVWWDRYTEADCWVCGKEFPLLERPKKMEKFKMPPVSEFRTIDLQRALNTPGGFSLGFVEFTTEDENGMTVSVRMNDWAANMFRAMAQVAEEAAEGYRRMYMSLGRRNGLNNFRSVLDEYIAFDVEMTGWGGGGRNRWSVQPFHEPVGRSYHNPYIDEPSPFRRPNIRGPIWGWAALYNPLEDEGASYNFTRFVNQFLLPGWQNYQPPIPTFQLLEPRDWSEWTPGSTTGPPTTLNRRQRNV